MKNTFTENDRTDIRQVGHRRRPSHLNVITRESHVKWRDSVSRLQYLRGLVGWQQPTTCHRRHDWAPERHRWNRQQRPNPRQKTFKQKEQKSFTVSSSMQQWNSSFTTGTNFTDGKHYVWWDLPNPSKSCFCTEWETVAAEILLRSQIEQTITETLVSCHS